MIESSGDFCVIFKESNKWQRKFFDDFTSAEEFRDSKEKESRAFVREHVVVSTGGTVHFHTEIDALQHATKIQGAGVSVLNPSIEGLPQELLYSGKKKDELISQ